MYFIDLLMKAVRISECTGDTQKQRQDLERRVLYALEKNLIDKQDAEEISEIADLRISNKF